MHICNRIMGIYMRSKHSMYKSFLKCACFFQQNINSIQIQWCIADHKLHNCLSIDKVELKIHGYKLWNSILHALKSVWKSISVMQCSYLLLKTCEMNLFISAKHNDFTLYVAYKGIHMWLCAGNLIGRKPNPIIHELVHNNYAFRSY